MDKEEQKLRDKNYDKTHKEQHCALTKAWYAANRDYKKAYNKTWRKNNLEHKRAYDRNYRKVNKQKESAYQKDWQKANAEKCRDRARKHKALKQKTQVEPISEKSVYLRDGWKCQICHKRVNKKLRYPNPMSPSLDHIIPLSKGGNHIYANVQLAHWICNISKHNRILPWGEQMRMF